MTSDNDRLATSYFVLYVVDVKLS